MYPNESTAIRYLQTYLRQLSYHDPAIPPPPIDGIFGDVTRRALCEFQREQGLPVSGTATADTWAALYAAYRLSCAESTLPARVAFFPPFPQDYVLKPGCAGFCVTVLQYMLRELQIGIGDGIPVEPTGVYDDATEAAVRAFQDCCPEAESNGIVSRSVWNAIAGRYNALFERPPRE